MHIQVTVCVMCMWSPRRVLGVLLQVPFTLLFTDRASRCHGFADEAGLARQ